MSNTPIETSKGPQSAEVIMRENPIGLRGISFVEFASAVPEKLERLFTEFGFSKVMMHKSLPIDLFKQNDIVFLLNRAPNSFGHQFSDAHGPSICSMGWMVDEPAKALDAAVNRGARKGLSAGGKQTDYDLPSIFGIGDSLIYFTKVSKGDAVVGTFEKMGFVEHSKPINVKAKGFVSIDHMTNNVEYGTMAKWADFYKSVFNFSEIRYFDIRGVSTGLTSFALKSPDGSFCIPINEATEHESQINEYLREYKGPGIQHLALTTEDILDSLAMLKGTSIETLDMDAEYYEEAFRRVPQVTEDRKRVMDYNVLVDGDSEGYLLQIFTKNIIGPIFFEIIQRKNHFNFGEGNFKALFRSIERDQVKRGVVKA